MCPSFSSYGDSTEGLQEAGAQAGFNPVLISQHEEFGNPPCLQCWQLGTVGVLTSENKMLFLLQINQSFKMKKIGRLCWRSFQNCEEKARYRQKSCDADHKISAELDLIRNCWNYLACKQLLSGLHNISRPWNSCMQFFFLFPTIPMQKACYVLARVRSNSHELITSAQTIHENDLSILYLNSPLSFSVVEISQNVFSVSL